MLHQPNRNDPVKSAHYVTVIVVPHFNRKPLADLFRIGALSRRKVHCNDLYSVIFSDMLCKTAPSTAEIEDAHPLFSVQLSWRSDRIWPFAPHRDWRHFSNRRRYRLEYLQACAHRDCLQAHNEDQLLCRTIPLFLHIEQLGFCNIPTYGPGGLRFSPEFCLYDMANGLI